MDENDRRLTWSRALEDMKHGLPDKKTAVIPVADGRSGCKREASDGFAGSRGPALSERKREDERGLFAFLLSEGQGAPVGHRNGARDGQAQAATLRVRFAAVVEPYEALEDPVPVLGGDARTLVANRDLHPGSRFLD